MKKRMTSLLLALLLVFQLCGTMAYAAEADGVYASGEAGSLSWVVTDDGTLTISGTGPMDDYTFDEDTWVINTPWDADAFDITRIVVEEGVTYIGAYAFARLPSVERIEIAASVTEIADYAFENLYSGQPLIFFEGGAPAIRKNAFADSYIDVFYPEAAEGWDIMAGENYGGGILWHPVGDDGVLLEGTCGENLDGDYEPDDNLTWSIDRDGLLQVEGSGDLCDDPAWVDYWMLIEEVSLPQNLLSLGDSAFYGCDRLTAVELPPYIREIPTYTFYGCTALESVTFTGDMIETVGYAAFKYCEALTRIDLPDGITRIEDNAFDGCGVLHTVTLPGTLTYIGSRAFSLCEALESITIPASVTEIDRNAFVQCTGLSSVIFEGDAPAIGEYAFSYAGYYDGGLTACYPANNPTWTEAVMQDYGTTITWEAVDMGGDTGGGDTPVEPPMSGSCGDSLSWRMDGTTLYISGSGDMVDYHWLDNPTPWDLTLVEQVVFEEGCAITRIGDYAFNECAGLTSVDIPDTVTSIGDNAFYNCANLTSVQLPDSLQTVGETAFSMCPFTEITIPADVTHIGSMAFAWGGLTTVTMQGAEPELGDRVFGGAAITTYAPWVTWVSDQWGTVVYNGAPKDTTPPTLTVDGPENGTVLMKELSITFSLTVGDENGVAGFSMSYSQNGQTVTSDCAPFVISLHSLSDGPLEVTFMVEDLGGNITSETRSYIIDIRTDEPAVPEVSSTPQGIRLTWEALENEENLEGYFIFKQSQNGELTQLVQVEKGTTEWLYTEAVQGETYRFLLAAVAVSGLSSTADYVTITYTLPDTTPPVILDVWPASEDGVTLCHDGTLQVAASDNEALDKAEFFADGLKIGQAAFDASGVASVSWDCTAYEGAVSLTYIVYDKAGNTAEQQATVTVRPYSAPVTPSGLTVKNGFRSGTLSWSYGGDMQTLKQFNIYDADSDMLVTSVKGYSYTFRNMEEACAYKVAAVDIYGKQSFSTEAVTVTPVLTETVAPRAVMQTEKLTAMTEKPVVFSGANSTDNDAVASWAWDFGDGTAAAGVHAEHTYKAAGTYTVTLTVTDRSGNRGTASAQVEVFDALGENATHALLTVNVMDGYQEGTPGISGVTVTVYNDSHTAVAGTDSSGAAELAMPAGSYTMTIVKNGYDGKMMQIEVTTGPQSANVYLSRSGVDVVGGKLTVEEMTYDEIVEAGIDVSAPANNHVVKQSLTIRFQPTPETRFELPIEQIVNAAGDVLRGLGFGWHTFTPDPSDPGPVTPDPDPDDPEDDENDGNDGEGSDIIVDDLFSWGTPNYKVGVYPVGDSAYMVIYGQTHWLKEMFNVELITFNNSYVEDLTGCVAELDLPEGLSLADMLEGTQSASVYLGDLPHQGGGLDESASIRQVNWYVRGDAEGDYRLTAAVSGYKSGEPFSTTFTAEEPIHVYAGSALQLVVTMPKSAYAEKEYAVKFSLQNVSDKPIYNLSFGLDSAQQFTAERMSDGTVGETQKVFSNEDFANNMTYGLPVLQPGQSFDLVLRTTFAYDHQFIEWAVGKVPGLEVGYRAAQVFVTTLEGSTTEIPVHIVLEDVKKDDLFQWLWDETIGALKDNAKDAVVEFIDDKVFQGIPVVEKGLEVIEVVTNVNDELNGPDIEYTPTVSVTEGVLIVPENDVDDWLREFDTYALRRTALPGIIVWTDAADAVISEDGRSMALPSGGKLYTMRLGETAAEPQINVTTYYVDGSGEVQSFTRTLSAEGDYASGLKTAKHLLMDELDDNTFAIPADGELVEVPFTGFRISEDGTILMQASNESWTVEGEDTTGLTMLNGKLIVDSTAKAGTYTVRMTLDGTDAVFTQTVVLTGGSGTMPMTLGALQLSALDGQTLDAIPDGTFWVSVPVTGDGQTLVLLAAYDANGRFLRADSLTWTVPAGETAPCSFLLTNASGEIAELRAFALSSDGTMTPLATPAAVK